MSAMPCPQKFVGRLASKVVLIRHITEGFTGDLLLYGNEILLVLAELDFYAGHCGLFYSGFLDNVIPNEFKRASGNKQESDTE
jgi:hypothetical protein